MARRGAGIGRASSNAALASLWKRRKKREGVIRLERESQFYGPNLGYVLELYESYREDPESVDERTRNFFDSWSPPRVAETNGQVTSAARSEEHTSELQPANISYAVFCLKKKKHRLP